MGAHLPNARYLMPAPDYRFFHPTGPRRSRCRAPSMSRSALTAPDLCSRTASFPLKSPARSCSGHRIIGSAIRCAACGRGAHTRLLGAVAGRGPAGSVRRGRYPQPHSAASTRGRLCVRLEPDCSRGYPCAGAHRGRARRSRRHSRALPWPRRCDHPRERRSIRHRQMKEPDLL